MSQWFQKSSAVEASESLYMWDRVKHLYNYVISNRLLTPFQSGFIKGNSSVNQLAFLYNDIGRALDEKGKKYGLSFVMYQRHSIEFGIKVSFISCHPSVLVVPFSISSPLIFLIANNG